METTLPEAVSTNTVPQVNLTQSHYVVNTPTTNNSEIPPKKIISIKKKPENEIPPKKRGRKKKNGGKDDESEIAYVPHIYNDSYLDEIDEDDLYDNDDELYEEGEMSEPFNRYDEHMEQIVHVLIDIKRSIDINSQCLLKLLTEMNM
jgi:hypothetical protein